MALLSFVPARAPAQAPLTIQLLSFLSAFIRVKIESVLAILPSALAASYLIKGFSPFSRISFKSGTACLSSIILSASIISLFRSESAVSKRFNSGPVALLFLIRPNAHTIFCWTRVAGRRFSFSFLSFFLKGILILGNNRLRGFLYVKSSNSGGTASSAGKVLNTNAAILD